MDQAASLLGGREHALLLDCGSLEHRHVAFPAALELLVVDSGVARSLDDSPYAERRAEVESGVPKRLRHVRSENERVREVVAALETGDREALRAAFTAGHASLRDDFEVSTPLLDSLVESALAAGAVAARLTGAGFGGSIVALVERGTGAEVGSLVTARHPGSAAYVSRPAGGAADVTLVRPARPDEADAVSDLVQRAYGHYVERIGRRPSPMDADYERLAAAGELWTLEEAAGVVLLRGNDGHMLVDNLAVEPELQGTGLGRRLLQFAEDEARLRGLRELRLYTNLAMTENIALYTRLGWEEYDRRLEGAFSRVYFRKAVGP
jgi:GNAT superfamily N-acetyltransferase